MTSSGAIRRHCSRRHFVAASLLLGASAWASKVFGGSYLDRAAVMLSTAKTEASFLHARLDDKELAQVLHKTAKARLAAGGSMQVPKEVVQAHPHLLLVLESYERATSAAASGGTQRFLVYLRRAREEEAVLRGVLEQLGWTLPRV